MAASSLRSFTDSLTDPEDTSAITLIKNHLQVQRLLKGQLIDVCLMHSQRLDKLFAGYKWNFKAAKAKENITKNRFQDRLPSMPCGRCLQ